MKIREKKKKIEEIRTQKGRERMLRKESKRKRRRKVTMTFWNVVGLGNKDRDFCEGLKERDVMILVETCLDERGLEKIRGRLPKGYKWIRQVAERKAKKKEL